jgi:hypothetical protein
VKTKKNALTAKNPCLRHGSSTRNAVGVIKMETELTWEEELPKMINSIKEQERNKIKKAMKSFGHDAKDFWTWYDLKNSLK